jgi:hypothetical protein
MENLISTGFSLSAQLGRKLKIIYVFDFDWSSSGWATGGEFVGATAPTIDANVGMAKTEIRRNYEKASDEIRRITARYLEKNLQVIPFEIDVSETSRLHLVEKIVAEEKDVLLMMGNYNSYAEFAPGSLNFPNAVDKAPCPVLLVPENIQVISVSNWVYATAFHPEDLTALAHLSDLFGRNSGKKLTIFHNSKSDEFEIRLKWSGFQTEARKVASGFDLDFELSYEKDVRQGLRKFIETHDPGLIVVLKEKKGFFEEIFSGSETHYVVTHFDKPVLVYHEENLS